MSYVEILSEHIDLEDTLQKQKSIRRKLLARQNISYVEKRIAILGGSTTADIKNLLEIFLLQSDIRATFYESSYNRYYEEAVFPNEELDMFHPEIIIVFTSVSNLTCTPDVDDSETEIEKKLNQEYARYERIWVSLEEKYHASVIQNNIELPCVDELGNLGATQGLSRFVNSLNEKFATYAVTHKNFYIHDLHGLAARIGLKNWHNRPQYHAYKFAMSYEAMPEVAFNLAKIVRALLGKNKKCLVLDLDNTLWGGVIGEDGAENIQIGRETPIAEAYTEFQRYVLSLKKRGVILAVCSKNDADIAKNGFTHPDSILHLEDFAIFCANWKEKNENILDIARELNIGTSALVFIDDNPFERQLVRNTLPEISVPEVNPADVFSYIQAIENAGYFEPVTISEDDLKRNDTYRENRQRQISASQVTSYDDFLRSLNMKAEIDSFKPVYFDRIAQLTNKTNQFNLTTRRYTRAEIEKMANDPAFITLYGRLSDDFGNNGLISVIVGEKRGDEIHILLWLMSCRVLKRGMEYAMLDKLVSRAEDMGYKKIIGYYFPTRKNKMVEDFYSSVGFSLVEQNDTGMIWKLCTEEYELKNKFIDVGDI